MSMTNSCLDSRGCSPFANDISDELCSTEDFVA